jgi:hypothetical protein
VGTTSFTYEYFISRRGRIAALAQENGRRPGGEGLQNQSSGLNTFAASGHFVIDADDALRQARHLLIRFTAKLAARKPLLDILQTELFRLLIVAEQFRIPPPSNYCP